MRITLEIDTEKITELDREILLPIFVRYNALSENDGLSESPAPAPAKSTPAKATPAKATPAKATPAKATPAKATPAKVEAPEETEDEYDDEEDTATMEAATRAATKLVSSGEAARVKDALGKVGAKRVSEISAGNLAKFIRLLES
jgi:hypothetical protein